MKREPVIGETEGKKENRGIETGRKAAEEKPLKRNQKGSFWRERNREKSGGRETGDRNRKESRGRETEGEKFKGAAVRKPEKTAELPGLYRGAPLMYMSKKEKNI